MKISERFNAFSARFKIFGSITSIKPVGTGPDRCNSVDRLSSKFVQLIAISPRSNDRALILEKTAEGEKKCNLLRTNLGWLEKKIEDFKAIPVPETAPKKKSGTEPK